jgi:hypothetical protein
MGTKVGEEVDSLRQQLEVLRASGTDKPIMCRCVCVCVCVSISVYLYLYLYLYHREK